MKKQPIEDFEKTNQSMRVLRGGSWDFSAEVARISLRNRSDPSNRDSYLGFRIVRNKDTKK